MICTCQVAHIYLEQRFKHEHSLWQGGPLSPYLFVLVIDTLQGIFELGTDDGHPSKLHGRQAKLRLSLYAVDAVAFVDMVLKIMKSSGDATGLRQQKPILLTSLG